jgi:hypothetical protein
VIAPAFRARKTGSRRAPRKALLIFLDSSMFAARIDRSRTSVLGSPVDSAACRIMDSLSGVRFPIAREKSRPRPRPAPISARAAFGAEGNFLNSSIATRIWTGAAPVSVRRMEARSE